MPHALLDRPPPGPAADSPAPESGPAAELAAARSGASRWPVLVKLAVSLGVLWILLSGADWNDLAARLSAADPRLLAAGIAVKAMTLPLAALRWRAAGRAAGMVLSRLTAFKLQMASIFLGQVLPGAVGGDLLRGWFTWRLGQSPGAVVAAMVLDRMTALLGVALLGLVGLPRLAAVAPPALVWSVLGIAAVLGAGTAVLAFAGRLPLPALLRRGTVGAMLSTALGTAQAMVRRPAAWAALGYSTAVHVATIATAILYARALGLPLGWLDGLIVVPAAIVAAALPVSLGGWGVREGAMVAGFTLLGLDPGTALLVSLLIGGSMVLLSLPGAVCWLLLRSEAAASEPAAPKPVAPKPVAPEPVRPEPV